MKKYRAILFDLFGTVALIDTKKLPVFELEQNAACVAMSELRTVYEQTVTGIPFFRFIAELEFIKANAESARDHELKEIPCVNRFELALMRAGEKDASVAKSLAIELVLAHNTDLVNATVVPPANATFLSQLYTRYRLAIISNFDHGPTARQILSTSGIKEYFDHIMVSEEHGWRKPHTTIFTDVLAVLGVTPAEALFVGDTLAEDILGAKRVGMDVVWVNADDLSLPTDIPIPDYTVRAIHELDDLISE